MTSSRFQIVERYDKSFSFIEFKEFYQHLGYPYWFGIAVPVVMIHNFIGYQMMWTMTIYL